MQKLQESYKLGLDKWRYVSHCEWNTVFSSDYSRPPRLEDWLFNHFQEVGNVCELLLKTSVQKMCIRCHQWIEWKNDLNRYPCEFKCFRLDFFHTLFQLPGWMQTFMFSKQQRQSAKKQNCKLWCVKTEIFGFSVLNTIKSVYHNGGIMFFGGCFCAHQTDWLGLYSEIWHNNNRPLQLWYGNLYMKR